LFVQRLAKASKPFGANQRRKQVNQQQAGYDAREQSEDFHDLLSNLVASGDAGKEKREGGNA
jgi:hypothetical protein